MKDHHVRAALCPNCGKHHDMALNVTGKPKPKEGDFTLCGTCGAVLQFNFDLSLRLAEAEAIATFAERQPDFHRLMLEVSVATRQAYGLRLVQEAAGGPPAVDPHVSRSRH